MGQDNAELIAEARSVLADMETVSYTHLDV